MGWEGEERRRERLDLLEIAKLTAKETVSEIFQGFGYDISDPKEKIRLRLHMDYLGDLYRVCNTMKSTAFKTITGIAVASVVVCIVVGGVFLVTGSKKDANRAANIIENIVP